MSKFSNFLYRILGDEIMGFLFKERDDELEVKNADGIVEDGIMWKDGEIKGEVKGKLERLEKVMTFKKYNDEIIKSAKKKEKEKKKFTGKKLEFYELYGGIINPDKRKDVYEEWLKGQKTNGKKDEEV